MQAIAMPAETPMHKQGPQQQQKTMRTYVMIVAALHEESLLSQFPGQDSVGAEVGAVDGIVGAEVICSRLRRRT